MRVPIPHVVADGGALRLLRVLDRVVDHEEPRGVARAHAAAPDEEERSQVLVDRHLRSRLRAIGEAHLREHLPVVGAVDDAAHLVAELLGKVLRVGAEHDVLVWVSPDDPRREAPRGKFALTELRRHRHRETQDAASLDLLQCRRDDLVMHRRVVAREVWVVEILGVRHREAREGDQVVARLLRGDEPLRGLGLEFEARDLLRSLLGRHGDSDGFFLGRGHQAGVPPSSEYPTETFFATA
jgi:hypothetical protein